MSSKGQITIPLEVRRKLGVDAGDRIEFVELDDGKFAIVPAVDDVRALRGAVAKPARPVSVEEMRRIVVRRAQK